MKILKLLTPLLALCLLLSGCLSSLQPNDLDPAIPVNPGLAKLPDCLPEEGYEGTALQRYEYTMPDATLTLSFYSKDLPPETVGGGAKKMVGDFSCALLSGWHYWDGTVGSGEQLWMEMTADLPEHYAILYGVGEGPVVDAQVTPELFYDLLSGNSDLSPIRSGISANFRKGLIEVNLSVIDASDPAYAGLTEGEGDFVEADGLRYWQSTPERTTDDPNHRTLVCGLPEGALVISAGVPYEKRNEIAESRLDFVDLPLARSVADCLELELVDLAL